MPLCIPALRIRWRWSLRRCGLDIAERRLHALKALAVPVRLHLTRLEKRISSATAHGEILAANGNLQIKSTNGNKADPGGFGRHHADIADQQGTLPKSFREVRYLNGIHGFFSGCLYYKAGVGNKPLDLLLMVLTAVLDRCFAGAGASSAQKSKPLAQAYRGICCSAPSSPPCLSVPVHVHQPNFQ